MRITHNLIKNDVRARKACDYYHDHIRKVFNHLRAPIQTLLPTLLICLFASSAVVLAQSIPPKVAPSAHDNPLAANNKRFYGQMKAWLLSSAEKMPEESYNFKPTEAVRNYGRIIGHVADVQYVFCSSVRGEKDPSLKIEQTKTSKADLIAALKEAFIYCDTAYDGLSDVSAVQMVKAFGTDMPKLSVLTVNNMHTTLHYGNLITYMRLKNIVPPSTEAIEPTQPKK